MSLLKLASPSGFTGVGWQLPSDDIPDPPDPPPVSDPGMAAIMSGSGFRGDLLDLTPSGHVTATVNGQVIEGLDIDGGISIKANDVTIRDCRIRGWNGVFLIRYYAGFNGGLIEYNEVEGLNDPSNPVNGTNAALGGTGDPIGCTWQFNHLHGNMDGIKPGTGGLVYRNFIQVFKNPGSIEHRDCLQISGRSNIIVQENVGILDLNTGGNTGFFTQAWSNANIPVSGVKYIGNYAQGGNRGIEMRGGKTAKPLPPGFDNIDELITNCVIKNNKMIGPFRYDPWTVSNPIAHEISGNTFDGEPYPEVA